jgi:hypothetical protein
MVQLVDAFCSFSSQWSVGKSGSVSFAAGYEGAVPRLVRVLARMRAREVGDDYTYYGIASPWLQVRPS